MKKGKKQRAPKQKTPALITVRTLRTIVGLMGMLLPVVLYIFSGLQSQPSISDYYHLGEGWSIFQTRDIFVSFMVAMGVFLWAYHGYDITDRVLSKIAGSGSLLTAFVPCAPSLNPTPGETFRGYFHLGFAGVFLVFLAVISYFQFTLSDQKTIKGKKRTRNWIYRICGGSMIICLALIILHDWDVTARLLGSFTWPSYVYCFESAAVFAFGISWLVKGNTLPFLKEKWEK